MNLSLLARPHGLTSSAAQARRAEIGANEINRETSTSTWRMLAAQFKSAVIWLLLGACVISAALGEAADAVAIGTILVINVFVGFFQEYRAERSLLALRSMTAPRARVLRDGHATVIPAVEVVPGDVLLIEAGDIVAADAHLLEAHGLAANEAALTGESAPVEKSTAAVPASAPLAERLDMVFMGTSVAMGTATAEVVATGMRTELGSAGGRRATDGDVQRSRAEAPRGRDTRLCDGDLHRQDRDADHRRDGVGQA